MRFTSALLAASLTLASFVVGAQEPPGRAGRLAFAEGSVSVYMDPDIGWEPAYVNTPITSENSVWTDVGSHAELRVSGTSFRLDEATQLDMSAVADDQLDATLARGSLNVRVRHLFGALDINTPQARFTILSPGRYRIDSDPQRGESRLTVFEGRASMDGGAGRVSVPTGRSIVVWGSDRPAYALQAALTTEFDRWAGARDTHWTEQQAPRYVSTYMTGYEDLDANGQWINEPDYGPLWIPNRVANDWVPYRYGHWAWVRPWGWTWIDDQPWGYAPFHYGRWVQVRDRWAWYPGKRIERPVYAPALVAWVGGANWSVSVRDTSAPVVGWYALSPFDHYQPWYQANAAYVNKVNVNTTFTNRDRAFRYAESQREVNRVQTSTIVQREALTARRPVQQAIVHVTPEVLRQQQVAQQPTTVLPTRNDFVRARTAARTAPATSGGTPPAQGAAPSAASTARVVAPGAPAPAPTMAPPAQRPSFARKPSTPAPQAAAAGATPPAPSPVGRPTAPGQVQFGAGNAPPAPGAQQGFKGQENPARREATQQQEQQRVQQEQAARNAQQQQKAQQEQAARDQQKAQQEQARQAQQQQQQQRAQQEQAARDQQKGQQEQARQAQQQQQRAQQEQAAREQQKAQQERAAQEAQQRTSREAQQQQQQQQQRAQQEQATREQQKAQQEQARQAQQQQQQQQQRAQQEQAAREQQKAQQEQARQAQQQQQQRAQQEQAAREQQKAQQEQARQAQQQQQQRAQQEQAAREQQKAQQEQARQAQQQQQQRAQQEQAAREQQKAQQEQARQAQQQQQQHAQQPPPSPPADQAKGQARGKSKEEEDKDKEKEKK